MNEEDRITNRPCCNNDCNCISEIVKKIIYLQRESFRACSSSEGCSRPFLGPDSLECFNTRPVSFYNCSTGEIWTVEDSTFFRLESIDDCCCTCRVLNFTAGTYTSTNQFFTINLNCVSAIKCYGDINLAI